MQAHKIPKLIHYCWLSEEAFPELIQTCIKSWEKVLPDYEFVLWDKKKFDLSTSTWVKQAYDNKKYAFAADYIRIYSLFHFGGIYLDTDVEVLKNFDSFLYHDAFMGFESKTDIEAAVIGSMPHHPWLKDILDYYEKRSFIKDDGTYDTKILPVIISIISREKYGFEPNGRYQILKNNIHIYPKDFFSPKDIRTLEIHKSINSVTIHHFNAGWINKGLRYKLKRLIHLLLRRFGESFHLKTINIIRRFTGNSKL